MEKNKSEQDFKKKLTPEEYYVLRQGGTETPGTGKLLHNKKTGMYNCKVCGNKLFDSNTKFDSGTGWPSFDQAIPGSVNQKTDYKMIIPRTEVTCAKCGSHLGHVFTDGPKETTGKRFCMNSICLNFQEHSKSIKTRKNNKQTKTKIAK